MQFSQEQASLLSKFQAKEAGVIVNDIVRRHNGKKNIECNGYEIPSRVDDGLMNILMQEPTMDERLNCTRYM